MKTHAKKVKCRLYGEVTRDFCKTCTIPQGLRDGNCPHFQSIVMDKAPVRPYQKKSMGRQVA